ncbi:protein of unknown function [Petrocella atlantisensis]|uniref:Uncharacterized protein n=1 Tax=Petrocella atlantisensis TaxID=2173034 RepID=A0A3P7NZJ6_9FIRM|nr:protein of unknown function [Petrocella atlantisensis]
MYNKETASTTYNNDVRILLLKEKIKYGFRYIHCGINNCNAFNVYWNHISS